MTRRDVPPSLEDLQGRLKAARARHEAAHGKGRHAKGPAAGSGLGFGLRIAVDLLAGVAIGVGLGLVLDNWLGTAPLMLVVFLFLGAAAGMLNVYRAASGRGFAVGYSQGAADAEGPPETGPDGKGQDDQGPHDAAARKRDRGAKT